MWKICKFLFFVCCLASFASSMSFIIPPIVLSALAVLLWSVFFIMQSYAFNTECNKGGLWLVLLCVASILATKGGNIYGYINSILAIIPIYFILQLKLFYQKDLLETFVKYFAIIFAISWVFWFLHLCGLDLPHKVINVGADVDSMDKESQYRLYNYYFFIVNKSSLVETVYTRFCAIFIEPGYTGCLLSILLFIGNYQIRKPRNLIFFIALISTFSLAGYLLTFVGYTLQHIKNKRHRVRLLFTICIILAGMAFFMSYNNGDNWINYAIIERMEFDEDTGQIVGYNRSEEQFSNWFWEDFISGPNLFFGESQQFLQNMGYNNVDWKMYMSKYGLLATCFYIFYLIFPYFSCRSKNKYNIGIFVTIYILIWAQTMFYNFSLMYLSLFVLCVSIMRRDFVEIQR